MPLSVELVYVDYLYIGSDKLTDQLNRKRGVK
jgi:hypothetical protein